MALGCFVVSTLNNGTLPEPFWIWRLSSNLWVTEQRRATGAQGLVASRRVNAVAEAKSAAKSRINRQAGAIGVAVIRRACKRR